jgi:hypothetical protein
MISRIAIATLLSLFVFMSTVLTVHAHGGGLDAHGCHHDRKNGGYHCHQGPFAGQSLASKQEMLDTLEASNQQPKDLPLKVQYPHRSGNTSELNVTLRRTFL